jgi:hypothetical protein
MRFNINDKENLKKYKDTFFTGKGYETLINYLKNLILKYLIQEDYPCNVGPVLGIPMFKYADEIKSHQELLGRLKQLGQILGIKDISFKTEDNKTIYFNMDGEFTIQ